MWYQRKKGNNYNCDWYSTFCHCLRHRTHTKKKTNKTQLEIWNVFFKKKNSIYSVHVKGWINIGTFVWCWIHYLFCNIHILYSSISANQFSLTQQNKSHSRLTMWVPDNFFFSFSIVLCYVTSIRERQLFAHMFLYWSRLLTLIIALFGIQKRKSYTFYIADKSIFNRSILYYS